jgi:hypothetical protein
MIIEPCRSVHGEMGCIYPSERAVQVLWLCPDGASSMFRRRAHAQAEAEEHLHLD